MSKKNNFTPCQLEEIERMINCSLSAFACAQKDIFLCLEKSICKQNEEITRLNDQVYELTARVSRDSRCAVEAYECLEKKVCALKSCKCKKGCSNGKDYECQIMELAREIEFVQGEMNCKFQGVQENFCKILKIEHVQDEMLVSLQNQINCLKPCHKEKKCRSRSCSPKRCPSPKPCPKPSPPSSCSSSRTVSPQPCPHPEPHPCPEPCHSPRSSACSSRTASPECHK